jgi:DNA repair protein RecO
MKHKIAKSIILKRTNYQDADRIITLLTKEQGKIKVIAKGVRKQKSKLAGGLELLSVSEVSYIQGRSELHTLTSARLIKHYSQIVKDIDRTMMAYRFLGSINKICEDESGQEFFDLLTRGMILLDDFNIQIDLIELWFNLHMLAVTGHQPDLYNDNSGKKLVSNSSYDFDLDTMTFMNSKTDNFNQNHIKLLRLLAEDNSGIKLSKLESADALTVKEDLKLTSLICKYYLNV